MSDSTGQFPGPLFIVGMPRSGTKLLRGILASHERVAIPDAETEFLPYWVGRWPAYGDLSDRRSFDRFAAGCRSLPFFRYLARDGRDVDTGAWFRNCRGYAPEQVFEALLRTVLGLVRGDGTIWGDKSPSYLTQMPLLRRLYPGARFVHIVRDVRDYCLSMNKAWGKNVERAAQRWADDVACARAAARRLGDACCELRYEDLLEDPDGTMREVCSFLEIPYRPELLELQGSVEKVGDARGARTIVRGNARKFETALPARTRARIEGIAGKTLREAGYDCPVRAARRIGPSRMRLLQLRDGVNLVVTEAREWGYLGALRFVASYFRISGNRRSA